MKEKEEKLEVEGEVIEALRSRMFRVRLDNGHEALGYMGGRMKRYRIRVFPGDRVRIELSSYDLTRGRIVYRLSGRDSAATPPRQLYLDRGHKQARRASRTGRDPVRRRLG
jgi:translation initiation factor IF-1